MLLLDQHAARKHLRVGEDLIDALDLGTWHFDGVELRETVCNRARRHPGSHDGQDFEAVRVPSARTVKARVGGEGRTAYQGREPFPGIVNLGGDHDIAVGGAEHAVQGRLRQVVAGLHRDLGAAGEGGEVLAGVQEAAGQV